MLLNTKLGRDVHISSSPWLEVLQKTDIFGKRWHKTFIWNAYMRWDVQATLTHNHTTCYSQVVPRIRIRIFNHHGGQTWLPRTFHATNFWGWDGGGESHSPWTGEWKPIMLKSLKTLTFYKQDKWGASLPTQPAWYWDTVHQTASSSHTRWWWTVLQGKRQQECFTMFSRGCPVLNARFHLQRFLPPKVKIQVKLRLTSCWISPAPIYHLLVSTRDEVG